MSSLRVDASWKRHHSPHIDDTDGNARPDRILIRVECKCIVFKCTTVPLCCNEHFVNSVV